MTDASVHKRSVLSWVRGWSPLGPIFGKELRTTARRKRTYVLRFCYLGVLLLVLLFVYAVNYWENYGYMGVARKAQRMAEMGVYFFAAFSFFTMGAMALLGPILTSTAINAERLHKTLPVLLMTPITAWQIVAGKLFSRLLIAFTLIGLSLPVLALVRLLGGVEIWQMLASLTLCITVAITSAAIGLLFSTLLSRAYAVILLSYGLMGIMYGLIPLMLIIVLEGILDMRNRGVAIFFDFLGWTNPGASMFLVSIPERPPFRLGAWWQTVATHLAFSLLLVVWTAVILRRRAKKENEGGGGPAVAPMVIDGPGEASAEGLQAPVRESPPTPAATIPTRPVSDNPVLWRELRRPLLNRNWQRWGMSILVLGCLGVIYLGMGMENGLDDADPQMGFAVVFCVILNLLACVLAGSAIAQEKESDTWTLLLATPISAQRIVLGKLAGLLRKLLWPAVLIVSHFALFTVGGVIGFDTFLAILWLMFVFNVVWLATGLYFSLRLRTVTFAVIANLLLPVTLYGGVALVLAIVGALFFRSPELAELVGLYMPYAHLLGIIDATDSYTYGYGGNVWTPMFGRISLVECYTVVFAVGCAHLAAAGAVLWYTIVRFNSIVGRADQRVAMTGRLSAAGR